LTQVLEAMGFLQRTNGDRDYTLGPAVLTMGFEYIGSLDIVELARPVLIRLRDETGYSAHLVSRHGRDIIYLCRYAGLTSISSSINVGATLPAHATVIGRALIADLPVDELRALYDGQPMERYSEHTPTTLAELQAMLVEDRRRGYVASASFFESGVATVAAPIHDRSGRTVAAISITTNGVQVSRETLHGDLKAKVCAAADAISAMLDGPARGERAAAADRPAQRSRETV
jgi:DNA-binding IclR family transcriptional regulator